MDLYTHTAITEKIVVFMWRKKRFAYGAVWIKNIFKKSSSGTTILPDNFPCIRNIKLPMAILRGQCRVSS